MTTSGTYTSGLTLNEAATESLDLLQVGQDGETLTGDMQTRWKNTANLVLTEWHTQGLHLWAETEGTLFLTVGQSKYDFRLSTTHVANTWYETTTTAATLAAATVIPVTSVANIQVGDKIGIIQNDNDLFWTTVASIASLNVTVNDPITLATLSGATVYNYRAATATVPELLPISRMSKDGVRRRESTDYEIPVNFTSRKEYFDLPNKNQNGTVIQAYYSRQDIAGETSGIMYVWNPPSSSLPVLNFTYERKLQKLTAATQTIDIPDYAQNAFIYTVAERLIPKFGASAERTALIVSKAEQLRNDMLAFDAPVYPIKIRMRRRG